MSSRKRTTRNVVSDSEEEEEAEENEEEEEEEEEEEKEKDKRGVKVARNRATEVPSDEDEDEDESDDENSDGDSDDDDDNNEGSDSDSDSNSDSDSESESESESDDEDLSQRELSQIRNEVKANKSEAEVGVIEEITLINFMSHRHLHLKLGAQTNFITGPNGAGKSAILVALTTALGARSGFTGRGTKLGDLVRNDPEAHYAQITVRLRNRGPEAFQHATYGDSILVVKKIPKSGPTSLHIKDHHGHNTEDSNAAKLQEMLDHFNIQINNPCAILMQDTSKGFLANSTPGQKYSFFLKATQLENIRNDYVKMEGYLKEGHELVARKKRLLPQLEEHLKACEQAYQLLNLVTELEAKRRELRAQLAWCLYREETRKLREEEGRKKRCDDELAKRSGDLDSLQQEKAAAEAEAQRIQLELAAVVEQLTAETRAKKSWAERVRAANNEVVSAKRKLAALAEQRSGRDKRAARLQQAIEKERTDNRTEYQQAIEAKEREIYERKAVLLELQAAVEARRLQVDEMARQCDQGRSRIREVEQQMARIDHERKEIATQIAKLNHQRENRAAAFGREFPALLARIAREGHRFRRPPLGPIGLHVTLRDERWAFVTESHCSRILRTMAVDNHDDQRLLSQMASECGFGNLSIITTRFRDTRYELPPHMLPHPSLLTMMGVLDIDHPMAFNLLVDHAEIEQVVLIDNYDQAKRQLFTTEERRTNIGQVLLPDGTRMTNKRGSQNIHPPPHDKGYRMLSNNPQMIIAQLTQRREEADRALQERTQLLSQVKAELEPLYAQKRSLDSELYRQESEAHSVNATVRDLTQDKLRLERALEKEKSPDEEKSQLQEALDNLMQEIAQLDEDMRRQDEAVQTLQQQHQELMSQQDHMQTRGLVERGETLQAALKRQEDLLGELTQRHARNQMFVKELSSRAEREIVPKIQAAEQRVSQVHAAAEQLGPAPEDLAQLEPPEALEEKIDIITHKIAEEQKEPRSAAEVTQEYVNAKKKYQSAKSSIQQLDTFLQNGERSLEERVNRWKRFLKSLSLRTQLYFNTNLSIRGHHGSITFDHGKETLDVQVAINKTGAAESNAAVSQTTRSLSGGERSFSTVSLLLALWETMDVPFRAMDEFDVFMDAPNRRIAINLLQQAAFAAPHRQFIFITPHDPSVIHRNEMVKIHQLAKPRQASESANRLGYASLT